MDKLEELRAFTFGMQAAFSSVLAALMTTHPNPAQLRMALEAFRQRELAYLENSPYPEHALDTFRAMWTRFEFDIPPAPQSDSA